MECQHSRWPFGIMLICAQAGCLAGMAQLRRFDAGSNLLDRLEDITALQASVPGLQELNLRGCPVVNCKSYWQATLTKLPNLVVLDGHSIGAVERQQVVAKAGTVTAGLIRSSAFAETGARVWPASVDTVDADAPPGGDDDKWAMVAYLDLSHRLIRRLANLTPLVNLRRANFSDNDVRRCPLRSWYAVEWWFGSRVLARLVGSRGRAAYVVFAATVVAVVITVAAVLPTPVLGHGLSVM